MVRADGTGMIFLWNKSKQPTKVLRALLKVVAKRIKYRKPIFIRVVDAKWGHDGEAHQHLIFHRMDLLAPPAVSPKRFLRVLLHEWGHIKDYDFDPERSIMPWSCQTEQFQLTGEQGLWADRPEEKRANLHTDLWYPLLVDDPEIKSLLEKLDG